MTKPPLLACSCSPVYLQAIRLTGCSPRKRVARLLLAPRRRCKGHACKISHILRRAFTRGSSGFRCDAQAYFLLLWDTPVSLVGLTYLLLAAALFVAPPLRGRFALRDRHSGHYSDFPPGLAQTALQHQRLDPGARALAPPRFRHFQRTPFPVTRSVQRCSEVCCRKQRLRVRVRPSVMFAAA